MKYIYLTFLFFFPTTVFADDIRQEANEQYYQTVQKIEIVKDESRSTLARENAFKDIVEAYEKNSDNLYLVLKDGLFEILIDDATFFFEQFSKYPSAYKFWLDHFSLRWLKETESEYPHLKEISIISLKNEISKTEKILDMQKETIELLKKTLPEELK